MLKKTALAASLAVIIIIQAAASALAYDSLAYLYGGSTSTYLQLAERTKGALTTVCPDYFETGNDGNLKYSKSVDPLLLSSLADKGITVTPFLSNHWNRDQARAMLQNRAQFAAQLAQAVIDHKLDGLDIDIQNIIETDKDNFTDFIRLLRQAMPEGTELTVCVPANPYYTDEGWQGGYDYAALSEYCDHIFIMTYDESYPGSTPGPVASYWFIEASIQYGLERVPKEKLMTGIPLYGRYWTNSVKGSAFTTADIEWLVKNTNATVWYDEKEDCARATVHVPAGTTVTTWGGRVLSAGTYDIWYDNDRSYEKKLALVRKYGIKGVGMWALGQEPAEFWSGYPAWLEGYPFKDIGRHWALSYIIKLTETGIADGKPGGIFDPEGKLTRAQAAALLVRLAGLNAGSQTHPFTDIQGHWGAAEIAAAYEAELINGVEETLFMPNREITREEFAVMAERYTNLEDTFDLTQTFFSDVSPEENPWSHKAISKLCLNNVLSGFPGGEFRPKTPITRAEASKVICLLAELPTRFISGQVLPLEKAHMEPR